jgi:hypothetical protein
MFATLGYQLQTGATVVQLSRPGVPPLTAVVCILLRLFARRLREPFHDPP